MIPAHGFAGQFRQRPPVELHDQPVRLQVRIHPVESETLLDVKLATRIPVEDDFGQQAVDGHDSNLAVDLNPGGCAGPI